jgi:hypothetical protein
MAANAGKLCAVKLSGSGLSMTAEATTGTGNTSYQITNTAKRVLDPTAAITVKDGGVTTVESYTLDRLQGKIVFGSTVGPHHHRRRDVSADDDDRRGEGVLASRRRTRDARGHGIPRHRRHADPERERLQRLRRPVEEREQNFKTALDAAVPVVLEFSRASGTVFARAWALFQTNGIIGREEGTDQETIAFDGSADTDGRSYTFLE